MTRVVFFGTPPFARAVLAALLDASGVSITCVVTNPDRPAGRGKIVSPSAVAELAIERGLPVLKPSSIKRELDSFRRELESFGPFDIGIVVAFGQILPEAVLSLPRCGCVNVHASLLPRWRGAAPIQRAIMAGDSITGVDIMQMESGLDTGPIYARHEVPIADTTTAGELQLTLEAIGATLLVKSLPLIIGGSSLPTPQSETGVTYAQKITNDEARIDWSRSSPEVVRHVHALSPHPGAFTLLDGLRLKVFKARVVRSSEAGPPPGTITAVSRELLRVQCGTGELALEELQLEGKKRLVTDEFLAGYPVKVNTILGT